MPEAQRHINLNKGLCGILVAAQLLGGWLAVAQTTAHSTARQRPSAMRLNTAPTAVAATSRTDPAIAVSPRILDFLSVPVGSARNLSFTVQNVGGGILAGAAKASGPFAIVGGSPYVLGGSQSQVITVQYLPRTSGMDMAVIRLMGGAGASITVAGSAVPTRPTAPASPTAPGPPLNLRMVAGR